MKLKLHIPYPILLIAAILLDRIAVSTGQINIEQSMRVLFALLLVTSVISYILQYYFLKDWHYTDFVVLLVPVTFLIYRSLYGFLKIKFPQQSVVLGLVFIFIFGLLYFALVNPRVWRLIRSPARISTYFYLVFSLLLSFQCMRLSRDRFDLLASPNRSQETAIPSSAVEVRLLEGTAPDIYVIVLDGYGRQDVLEQIYKYDNSEFLHGLEERGFYIANESHSNYVQTPYSMSSFWNLDYLPTWDSAYDYDQYLYQPIQNNRVFDALGKIGYLTVSTEGGTHFTEIRNSDIYLSDFLPLNDFETFLLVDSPVEPLSNVVNLGLPLQTYKTHSQHIRYQLEMLKKIPTEIPQAKIVYTHILAPHPPFVFDRDGDISMHQQPFTLAEGAGAQGGRDEYVRGYREQIQFINGEIMESIDAILATSEIPPIIILMGDHGPSSMFNFSVEDHGCVWERTGNLYAVLLPGHQNDGTLYSSISPVNTFRVIFNMYFGTDFPLLEDKSYLRFWQEPALNVDVTEDRDSLNGCRMPESEFVVGRKLK